MLILAFSNGSSFMILTLSKVSSKVVKPHFIKGVKINTSKSLRVVSMMNHIYYYSLFFISLVFLNRFWKILGLNSLKINSKNNLFYKKSWKRDPITIYLQVASFNNATFEKIISWPFFGRFESILDLNSLEINSENNLFYKKSWQRDPIPTF